MVPQQSHDGNTAPSQSDIAVKDENDMMAIDDLENSTIFGSQQVKETSNTPYTDATQVSAKSYSYLVFVVSKNILN